MLKSKKFNLKLKKFNLPIRVIGVVAIGALCAAVPTSGQYTTDITQVVQNNIAQAAVQQVNQILCLISNSNYFNYTNQGWQFAMVDGNMCNTSGNPGQQSNGNNATGIPDYFNILFNSTRNGSNPQIVDFSMTANLNVGDGGSQPVKILAVLTATASPTTDNYYGIFDFEIAGYMESDTSFSNPVIQGYIRSSLNSDGIPVLQQYLSSGGSNNTNQVFLVGDGIASGYGLASVPDNGIAESMPMAYNANNLYVQQHNQDFCYDRNQIESYIYQYGVYNQDGSALAHANSGYPITYQGVQGFYDYYGMSLPNGTIPVNGSAITYTDAGGSVHSGTVIRESGIMQAYTPQAYTLAQLNGVQMSVPEPNQQFNGSNVSDIITWNGTGFSKIGTQNCSSNGCTTTLLSTPTAYGAAQFESIAQTSGNGSSGTVGIFLNGLGAGGNTQFTIFESCSFAPPSPNSGYQPPICSNYINPTDATILNTWNVHSLAPVLSPESPVIFYCTSQCPYESGGVWYNSQPAMDGSGGQLNSQNLPYLVYSFDPYNYTLTLESNSVLPQQLIVDTNLNDFGVFSGPLLTESQFNQIGGAVESTQTPNLESMYNGTVSGYFQWMTSGQSYNQYTAINSGGSVVTLSAPLQLIYSSNGGNNFLQYSGVGNLQGIPGACYTESQGGLTPTNNCGGSGTIWEPAYNIPTGSTVNDLFGHTYYVKQLFMSQQLNQEGGGSNSCSTNADLAANLVAAGQLSLPDISSWVNPTESVSSIAPESAPLVVINGVAVGS